MNLTDNFTYEEFIRSERAKVEFINNKPPDALIPAMRITCQGLERIRLITGHPIYILSGYRCYALNKILGGVTDNPATPQIEMSQHEKGEAADIVCPKFGTAKELALLIKKHELGIRYDQLIYEKSWVHVSFVAHLPRYETWTLTAGGLYTKGIV